MNTISIMMLFSMMPRRSASRLRIVKEKAACTHTLLCKSYLRVNLAKVLIGFDSKKEDFRLRRRLMALLPSDNLDKNDWRRFKLALMLPPPDIGISDVIGGKT